MSNRISPRAPSPPPLYPGFLVKNAAQPGARGAAPGRALRRTKEENSPGLPEYEMSRLEVKLVSRSIWINITSALSHSHIEVKQTKANIGSRIWFNKPVSCPPSYKNIRTDVHFYKIRLCKSALNDMNWPHIKFTALSDLYAAITLVDIRTWLDNALSQVTRHSGVRIRRIERQLRAAINRPCKWALKSFHLIQSDFNDTLDTVVSLPRTVPTHQHDNSGNGSGDNHVSMSINVCPYLPPPPDNSHPSRLRCQFLCSHPHTAPASQCLVFIQLV